MVYGNLARVYKHTRKMKDTIIDIQIQSQGARAFDTASVYRNEAEIGFAINESRVPRCELFITSKLGPSEQVWTCVYLRLVCECVFLCARVLLQTAPTPHTHARIHTHTHMHALVHTHIRTNYLDVFYHVCNIAHCLSLPSSLSHRDTRQLRRPYSPACNA